LHSNDKYNYPKFKLISNQFHRFHPDNHLCHRIENFVAHIADHPRIEILSAGKGRPVAVVHNSIRPIGHHNHRHHRKATFFAHICHCGNEIRWVHNGVWPDNS
jgi:hypothetical protein